MIESRQIQSLTEPEIARRLQVAAPQLHPPEKPIDITFPREYQINLPPPRQAGVLVPLFQLEGQWRVLLTRRTDTLPEHSGQVAFPGGRMDPEDPTPEFTALRESFEEIGLQPEWVRIHGRLDSFITNTNYIVTPVVGVIRWPFAMKVAENEVQRVFSIPLEWLAVPENHSVRPRPMTAPNPPLPVIYFELFDGELLWGVSAWITMNLLTILGNT